MRKCDLCGKDVDEGKALVVVLNNQVTKVICKNCEQ